MVAIRSHYPQIDFRGSKGGYPSCLSQLHEEVIATISTAIFLFDVDCQLRGGAVVTVSLGTDVELHTIQKPPFVADKGIFRLRVILVIFRVFDHCP